MSKPKQPKFVPPKTVRIYVDRNGAGMSADVSWDHAPAALAGMLDAFRLMTAEYPELIAQLSDVHGGIQQVADPFVDGWGKQSPSRRPIGF